LETTRLLDEQMKVLKVISEVTRRMDLNEFARLVGVTTNETLKQIQELTKTGHLRSTSGGYGITEKGKATLKAQTRVPEGSEFSFYMAVGQSTGLSVRTLKEFYDTIKTVDVASLEFHFCRGDFKNWLQAVVKDEVLAGEMDSLSNGELKGENLREKLVVLIEKRYDSEALR
jgi:hypothetical protein